MCGICGIVGPEAPRALQAMTRSLAHRGPDRGGIRQLGGGDRPHCGLGHRRLSILDLSEKGSQPMSHGNERWWITYNGEIYNFRELRRELEQDGAHFSSECDTEILLALYAREGEAMLTRLNGIFAFAIWDEQEGSLFLARDRLGVKPLYYAVHDSGLYFASEVKALIRAGVPAGMHLDALAQYLTFLWVPDPDTLFEGVFKLPPGHCATWRQARLSVRRWWDLSFDPGASSTDWPALVRDEVLAAAKRQTISDVPVGAFLSGGIDSSAIVAATAGGQPPMACYSVGMGDAGVRSDMVVDDLHYARRVASTFGVEYHERILEPDLADLLPLVVWHMDEPVADPAAIATYLICAAASEGRKVMLSGMGGDEIFAGYPRHLAARLSRGLDAIPANARGAVRRLADGRLTMGPPGRLRGPRRDLMKFLRGVDAPAHVRYLIYSSYYVQSELEELLEDDVAHRLRSNNPFARHLDYFDRVRDEHWLNQLLYVDMKTFLPCLNLMYTDKMSMARSVEVRVPLLDNELVDLAARVPPDLKLRRTRRKHVLKESMRGVLDPAIIDRRKAGFGAPVRSWLAGDLRAVVGELLSHERVRSRGLFKPSAVDRLIADNDSGRADNALRIWALITLELWQQTFLDPGDDSIGPIGSIR
jgi:asparagine synthase (glutamine-hydrolysing)